MGRQEGGRTGRAKQEQEQQQEMERGGDGGTLWVAKDGTKRTGSAHQLDWVERGQREGSERYPLCDLASTCGIVEPQGHSRRGGREMEE